MLPVQFPQELYHQPPRTWQAEGFSAPGVRSVFYENVPWHGKPTRVFAWIGMPYMQPGESCPGMVLLHGGGGTAFDEWVRIWNRRGYAAIAMDQCGCIPERPLPQDGVVHQRHELGGPPGWDAGFDQVDEPVEDQWGYHAVAAALRARQLLASQPGVDPHRIGVTGISWGGYLSCLVSGADPGFCCGITVYGCGFLGENSIWKDTVFPFKPIETMARWLELWDPAQFLPEAHMPFCWVSGTNDFANPLDSLKKSYRLPPGESTLCIRVEMPHSHVDGWAPDEIGVFADSIMKGGAPLPKFVRQDVEAGFIQATFESARPVMMVEINYTRALGQWQDRKYNRLPAEFDPQTGCARAEIPVNTSVCYLNVFDDRACVASSPHVNLQETEG
jgi:hypothetical protein